jgi:hypothetical protein
MREVSTHMGGAYESSGELGADSMKPATGMM